MPGEGRVVNGDLGVEADQSVSLGLVGRPLAHDRQRVHLHEVGVVIEHHADKAAGETPATVSAEVGTRQPQREGNMAGLKSSSPRCGWACTRTIASGCSFATCSISTPPSAEPITRMRCAARSSTAPR